MLAKRGEVTPPTQWITPAQKGVVPHGDAVTDGDPFWPDEDLNPVLRGWGRYFAVGNSSAKFHAVDDFVHMRMARLASTKHGLHGTNWASRFTYSWLKELKVYRLTGTVRYYGTASA